MGWYDGMLLYYNLIVGLFWLNSFEKWMFSVHILNLQSRAERLFVALIEGD